MEALEELIEAILRLISPPVLITEEEHREYCEKIRPQFEHARPIRGSQKCHSFSSIPGCPDQVKVKRFTDDKKSFTARVADLSN